MAETTKQDETSGDYKVGSTSNKISEQNRTYHSNRGRGRPNPNVSKALCIFGVSDLRQLLDRKHQDQEQSKSGPPPDPSHNYLKDPLRESCNHRISNNSNNEQIHRFNKVNSKNCSDMRSSRTHRDFEGRSGSAITEERHFDSHKISFIKNPVNIKIELSTSTGERTCKFDEETKLPDIKHIPNHRSQAQRTLVSDINRDSPESNRVREEYNRGRATRGRGKGGSTRGRGISCRGRFESSRERRDRGKGRGKGQGNHPFIGNKNKQKYSESDQPTKKDQSVHTDENWENECSGLLHEDVRKITGSNEVKLEHFTVDQNEYINEHEAYEEHEHLSEEYYDGGGEEYLDGDGEEYSKVVKGVHVNKDVTETEGNLNLLIKSPISQIIQEGSQRTVRFKLHDDSQNYQGTEIQQAEKKSILRSNNNVKENYIESEYSSLGLENLSIQENDKK